MHIVLGALAAIVTILVLLSRLADAGIYLGGLNPFLWKRRRAWRQKLQGNPIHTLQDPKDIAGLLVVGLAKLGGDISTEEKQAVLREFDATLMLGRRGATELLGSSAFLLGDTREFQEHLDRILDNAREKLSPAQTESVLAIMGRIAAVAGTPSEQQSRLLESARAKLGPAPAPRGTWG